MFERILVEHCSPTLAGIKSANLFSVSARLIEKNNVQFINCCNSLNKKGISICILNYFNGKVLVYVYRKKKLREEIFQPDTINFLQKYGYSGYSIEDYISTLQYKITSSGIFPHEIGLFLGYPLHDVIGFIENSGQNSQYTGFWKVYCNVNEAQKLFSKYKKCKKVYLNLFEKGKPIMQLTVAA